MITARASVSAFFTRGSVSFSRALSIFAKALASRDLKTAWAASRRRLGSFAINVSEPSAASSKPRTRLFSRTVSISEGGVATGSPVAASVSLSDGSLMKTFLASVEYRQALILDRFEQWAGARIAARRERVDGSRPYRRRSRS